MRAALSQQDLLTVIVGKDIVGLLQIVLLDGAGIADAEGIVMNRPSERTPDTAPSSTFHLAPSCVRILLDDSKSSLQQILGLVRLMHLDSF